MTMIERVARAIFRRRFTGLHELTNVALFGRVLTYDDLVECTATGAIVPMVLDDIYAEAREYIEAMREPTEDMINATKWPECGHNVDPRDGVLLDQWQAMIDAALTMSKQQ